MHPPKRGYVDTVADAMLSRAGEGGALRDRSADNMSAVPRTLSPELVLVSPELAEAARAGLPDRPWEAFLPAPAPVEPPVLRVVQSQPSLAPAPVSRHPTGYAVPGPRSGQRAIVVALLVLAAVVALSIRPVADAPVVATTAPPASQVGNPPTADGESEPRQDTSSASPAPVKTATPSRRTTDASPAARTRTKAAVPSTPAKPARGSSAGQPSSPRTAPAERTRAAPGGYVFGSELRLFVAAGGTTIAWFQAVTPCGSNVTIEGIPISKDGTFAARGSVAQRGGRAVVRLSGRVTAPRQIRGNLAAKGPGCDRVRPYAAVLS